MLRVGIVLAVLAFASANIHDRAYYEEKFFNWLSEHKISATSGQHFIHMLQNFADNDDIINTHNAGNATYKLGHNEFSHMNRDEWSAFVKGFQGKPETAADGIHEAPADVSALPASVDWVSAGGVTPVKDQGQCGSCWSFSTTGALEGAYFNKYKSLTSFSEQNLVDCDTRKGNPSGTDMGCNGGLMDSAFSWIQKNGGLCTEAAYPYVSGTTKTGGTCQTTCTKVTGSKISKYTDVTKNSDSALMSAIAQQPVSVAIEADQSSFQLYKSGVFTGTCGTKLDHGVLAVGYGTDASSGLDFYKIKNSWGPSWGESGYIRLVRGSTINSKQPQGQCGVLSGPPSYPTL